MTTRQRWAACLIGGFGLSMTAQYNLLVPLRARELGASFEVVGILVAAAAVAPGLTALLLGLVVDRLRPKRAFLIGTALVSVVAALFVLVDDYWLMLPLQVALGASRSFAWIAAQSYITTVGEDDDRAALAGRFSLFSNAGVMLGPLLAGGVGGLIGLRWAFLSLSAYAIAFLLLGITLAETGRSAVGKPREGVGLRSALGMVRERGMQVVLLLSSVRLWTNWAWGAFFPVFLADAGMAPGLVGTVVFARALTSTVSAPTTGFWSRRFGNTAATVLGLACGVVGLAIAPLSASLPYAYVSSVLVGIAVGVSLPLLLALLSEVVPRERRGAAVGLRVSVNQSAAAAAPLVLGPLIAAAGATVGFAVSGGMAGLVLAVTYWLSRRGLSAPAREPDPGPDLARDPGRGAA